MGTDRKSLRTTGLHTQWVKYGKTALLFGSVYDIKCSAGTKQSEVVYRGMASCQLRQSVQMFLSWFEHGL